MVDDYKWHSNNVQLSFFKAKMEATNQVYRTAVGKTWPTGWIRPKVDSISQQPLWHPHLLPGVGPKQEGCVVRQLGWHCDWEWDGWAGVGRPRDPGAVTTWCKGRAIICCPHTPLRQAWVPWAGACRKWFTVEYIKHYTLIYKYIQYIKYNLETCYI